MTFLKSKVWPVAAGFIVASIVMVIFEYVNSFFFPLPADLDWRNAEAVKAFSASLPWTAYILVLLGYIVGSFKGGCVTTYLSGEKEYRVTFALGILLTLAAVGNDVMLGLLGDAFSIVSLPMFIIFTYLGHRYLLRVHAKRSSLQA